MTNYVKTYVGDKRFVIQWDLTAVGGAETEGEKFEVKDANLISIEGVTTSSLNCRLYLSNFSNPDALRTSLLTDDSFLSPLPDSFGNPPLPPATRWVWPILAAGSGESHIALLFEEIE